MNVHFSPEQSDKQVRTPGPFVTLFSLRKCTRLGIENYYCIPEYYCDPDKHIHLNANTPLLCYVFVQIT